MTEGDSVKIVFSLSSIVKCTFKSSLKFPQNVYFDGVTLFIQSVALYHHGTYTCEGYTPEEHHVFAEAFVGVFGK